MDVREVLLVCTGNVCRSPMAAGLMAAALPDVRVRSAGTAALVGRRAEPDACDLLQARRTPIDAHRASQVDAAMCRSADVILTMDDGQRLELRRRFPFAQGKVFRLLGAAGDVSDPYRQGTEAFECALAQIDDGVNQWVERICQVSRP